jgi:hypothetical protein
LENSVLNELHDRSDIDGVRNYHNDFVVFGIDKGTQGNCLVMCRENDGLKVVDYFLGEPIPTVKWGDGFGVDYHANLAGCADESSSEDAKRSVHFWGETEGDSNGRALRGGSRADLTVVRLKGLIGNAFKEFTGAGANI